MVDKTKRKAGGAEQARALLRWLYGRQPRIIVYDPKVGPPPLFGRGTFVLLPKNGFEPVLPRKGGGGGTVEGGGCG